MLKVIPDTVAELVSMTTLRHSIQNKQLLPDQYHLLLQLAIRVQLGTNLVIEVQEFLERLALGRHDKSDNVHEKIWHRVTAEHDCQDTPHGV